MFQPDKKANECVRPMSAKVLALILIDDEIAFDFCLSREVIARFDDDGR